MRRLKKVLAPVVAILLALTMLLSAACSNKGGGESSGTKYTVTYYVDGIEYEKQTYKEGVSLVAPAEPTLTDYNFLGWNTKADGTGDDLVEGTPVTAPLTYHAVLETKSSGGGSGSTATETVTVTFMVDGSVYDTQKVAKNGTATRPSNPGKDGHQFTGWFKSSASAAYDFSTKVTADLTLEARFTALDPKIIEAGAYNESLYVIWADGNPVNAKVEYKSTETNVWSEVPKPLIRTNDDSTSEARVDIVGLSAGDYNVKVTPSGTSTAIELSAITVSAYDRSGYAHFSAKNNAYDKKGIGAYADDGTLKDGALVIYVTEANKNDVTGSAYQYNKQNNTYTEVDIKPYLHATATSNGVDTSKAYQGGIGEILNNRRYSGNDRMNVGIAKLSDVFGAVAIRILGKVENEVDYTGTKKSTILGLTDYDSEGNGGSIGDDGTMARMTNAHDITIEGVGVDSLVYGWGFHFIASPDNHEERDGTSFEVRNLTFEAYPEDAIGMEGVQHAKKQDSYWDASVERCWIHHNTFLPGYCPKPTESDKADGDGSCDFKRGQFYTASYNYFENCHKTNLVGSSGYVLQFNVSLHHNWWNNCKARQPLLRNANVHMYNNYVSGTTDTVSSVRATSYIFSEYNFFDSSKNVVKYGGEDGGNGEVKSFNDNVYGCYEAYDATVVKNREDTIPNKCQFIYGNIDYSKFDTNPDLFYYDAENKVSDCYLESATQARKTCMAFAGANGQSATPTDKNLYTPSGSVQVSSEGKKIDYANQSSMTGVVLNGVNKDGKFKGQGITFTLSAPAELVITGCSAKNADYLPELCRADGLVLARKFEKLTIVLEAGTYFIASGTSEGKNAKECTITSVTFRDTSASSAARVDAAKAAINALPEASALKTTDRALVAAAKAAFEALTSDEQQSFKTNSATQALYTKYSLCVSKLNTLLVQEVEALIDAIGTVTNSTASYDKIKAARTAYNALGELKPNVSAAKLAILTAAEAEFAKYAVSNFKNMVNALVSKATGLDSKSRAALEEMLADAKRIETAYNDLSDASEEGPSQKEQVATEYVQYTTTLSAIEQAMAYYTYKDAESYFDGKTVETSDSEAIAELTDAYEALTPAQQSRVQSRYSAIMSAWDEVKPKIDTCYFTRPGGSGLQMVASDDTVFSLSGGAGSNSGGTITTSEGKSVTVAYSLKLQSDTKLTINLGSSSATIIFYVSGSNGVKVAGTNYAPSNGKCTVTNATGSLLVERVSGSDTLLYVEVIYN